MAAEEEITFATDIGADPVELEGAISVPVQEAGLNTLDEPILDTLVSAWVSTRLGYEFPSAQGSCRIGCAPRAWDSGAMWGLFWENSTM
jgi:hypothetical protein